MEISLETVKMLVVQNTPFPFSSLLCLTLWLSYMKHYSLCVCVWLEREILKFSGPDSFPYQLEVHVMEDKWDGHSGADNTELRLRFHLNFVLRYINYSSYFSS